MKTRTLAAALAALGLAASSAQATVYTVNDAVGAGGVTGSITTDGSLGILGSTAITDWNLTLNDGSSTFNLHGPLSGANSQLDDNSGVALTATAAGLFFNFAGTASSFVLFQAPSIGSSINFWCINDLSSPCGTSFFPAGTTGLSEVVRVGSGTVIRQAYSGVVQIATTVGTGPNGGGVPEPATWAMMLLGFGGVGALLRRRRERSTAAYA
ncbi:MAG TPA: PEPxxWA-CTERM sorting domain-containing protein [Phenylobacterium sp.]|jgi:hypothetical protein